jgi:ERCC4-type nuclease
MYNKADEFTIIVDTREQMPWEFGYHVTSKRKLDTGDYTMEGFESIFTIERKMSVSEIATNITENRFKDVLERLGKIPHAYMLMEFSIEDIYIFPVGSDIPKKQWDKLRVKGHYIMKALIEAQINHNIHILFCGDSNNAERTAVSIMKRIYEKYGNQKKDNN